MISNRELLTGLVQQLNEQTTGINIYRVPPTNVDAPAVMVTGLDYSPHLVYGDTARQIDIELTVVVSARNTDLFDDLMDLMDPTVQGSIVAAVEADQTLDGRVTACTVKQVGSIRELTIGESSMWAATVTVEVMG